MSRKKISTEEAPQPVAPYSQGIKIEKFKSLVFVSGQAAIDPEEGEPIEGGIGEETRQTLENIKAILKESGASLDDVIKVNVYLNDIDEFDEMNEVYKEHFNDSEPARAAVEVSDLALNFKVEIEAIAAI